MTANQLIQQLEWLVEDNDGLDLDVCLGFKFEERVYEVNEVEQIDDFFLIMTDEMKDT